MQRIFRCWIFRVIKNLIDYGALFASVSTLICCALPSLFVVLGAGAVFAGIIGTFPFLVVLSYYKLQISLFALIMLFIAGLVNYKTSNMPCPADPELGRACMRTRRFSWILYWATFIVFVFSSFFTYILPLML